LKNYLVERFDDFLKLYCKGKGFQNTQKQKLAKTLFGLVNARKQRVFKKIAFSLTQNGISLTGRLLF
jgi:hypothetical protein